MQQRQATGSGSDVRVSGSPRVCDVRPEVRLSTVFFAVEFLQQIDRKLQLFVHAFCTLHKDVAMHHQLGDSAPFPWIT